VPNRMTGWHASGIAIPQSRHGHLCVFAHNVSRIITVESDWVGCAYLALRVAHDDLISDQHRPATL